MYTSYAHTAPGQGAQCTITPQPFQLIVAAFTVLPTAIVTASTGSAAASFTAIVTH